MTICLNNAVPGGKLRGGHLGGGHGGHLGPPPGRQLQDEGLHLTAQQGQNCAQTKSNVIRLLVLPAISKNDSKMNIVYVPYK